MDARGFGPGAFLICQLTYASLTQGDVTMKTIVFAVCLSLVATPAFAEGKSCEELKSEIEAKLQAKGVKGYTLDIVPADQVKDANVVGTCDGGSKKITYTRQ
jgi:predicted lipoprotein with Yx(FWY)xxD motif